MKPARLQIALLCAVAAASAAAARELPARAEGADDGQEPRLAAQLWIDPLGDGRFRVGVELIPDEGWHTYGEEPGDTGLPPKINWITPPGAEVEFGALAFPTPETFVDEEADLVSHGYSRPVLLATAVQTRAPVVPLEVEIEALVCANICLPAEFHLGGELRDGARNAAAAARFDAEAAGRPPASLAAVGAGGWLSALALGWLGGLILNLMPCVLPVLALKLTALAELAHGSGRARAVQAGAYAVGIALSMLALAAGVLALRAAGHAVGWGFQLQEPVFLVAVSAVVVAFALNLFGVFEIEVDTGRLGGLGPERAGAGRSLFDGLLAVVLATPCSAPFLGPAVGFAFASSAPVIVTIFLAVGLGLATPFLVAAAAPGWVRFLPRSGPWMRELRAVLGFSLLATAVLLLWVLGRAAGAGAMSGALAVLLGVAGVAWVLGALQRRERRVSGLAAAAALLGVAVLGIAAGNWQPAPDGAAKPLAIPSAREYDADALRAGLRAGRPAFVYFTADWCVTCKVTERTVLRDPRVARELEELGFEVYVADWTLRDERIRHSLAELGRAGVPVYALYAAGAPESPRLLPELLTVGSFLEAARETASRTPEAAASARAPGGAVSGGEGEPL